MDKTVKFLGWVGITYLMSMLLTLLVLAVKNVSFTKLEIFMFIITATITHIWNLEHKK